MHIVQIEGPEVVRAGAELRLDCDYDYMAEEEPQLDLKWYFNGSPIPVGNLWLCKTCFNFYLEEGQEIYNKKHELGWAHLKVVLLCLA